MEKFNAKQFIELNEPIDGLLSITRGHWTARRDIYNHTIRFRRVCALLDGKTPVKMMTATPLGNFLRGVNNGRKVEINSMPRAINKGKIIQYLGLSGAKGRDCEKVDDMIAYANAVLPEDVKREAIVLTFKGATQKWRDAGYTVYEAQDSDGRFVDVHLANNAGLDGMKGKKVIVAGKFDYPYKWYNDYYHDFINPDEDVPLNRRVATLTYGAMPVRISVFDSDFMGQMEMEFIAYFLEQAAGRARALREEDAEVYIFANVPIRDADEFRPVA